MNYSVGTRSSMRSFFGQRGPGRAVHTNAGPGPDYRKWALLRACAVLMSIALLVLLAAPAASSAAASLPSLNRLPTVSLGNSRAVPPGHICSSYPPLTRRILLGAGITTTLVSVPMGPVAAEGSEATSPSVVIDIEHRQGEVRFSDEEWRQRLSPEQYRVLRREATERRWTSPLNDEKRPGVFKCAGCGSPLFNMSAKYESGTGWPSFYAPLPGAVTEVPDNSLMFMPRTEVRCRRCQGHLGHVFDDGPAPTGLRYCMNGAALQFNPSPGAAETNGSA